MKMAFMFVSLDVLKHNVKIEKSSTVNHLCGVFKDVKCSIEVYVYAIFTCT